MRSAIAGVLIALAMAPGALAAGDGPFTPPAASVHYDRDRSYDLLHLELDLRVDPEAGTVAGTATNVLAPRAGAEGWSEPLGRIELDAAELQIEEVRIARDAAALGVIDAGGALPEGTPAEYEIDDARHKLLVFLDPPARGPVAVMARYSARPRGGLFFIRPEEGARDATVFVYSQGETENNRYWLPTYDFPDDKATSEAAFTVPKGYEATSVGRRLETRDEPDGWRTTRYRMETPHSTYLMAVVIGAFDVVTEKWEGIDLEYRVPRGRKEQIARSFSKTPDMMAFFSELTGRRYPWPRYAQNVVPRFIYGGMENVTASTLTDLTLHDARAHVDWPSDGLVAHELAHQWFGDLLTCENWSEIWLNEGAASYLTLMWFEHDLGRDEFDFRLKQRGRRYLDDTSRHGRPMVTRLYREQDDIFDSVAYSKGAWVLHMLRREVGEAAFRRGLALFVKRHAFGLMETVDLRRAMEQASGKDLGPFFDQWAHRGGHPRIEASWSYDREAKTVRLSLKQESRDADGADDTTTAKENTGDEPFRIGIEAELVWEGDRRERYRLTLDAETREAIIPAPERPVAVLLDPDRAVLKEMTFDRPPSELIAVLATARRGIERVDAAEALGSAPASPPVIEALVSALTGDPFRGVRQAAAGALGRLGGEAALTALSEAAGREADSRVREAIAKALGTYPAESGAGARLAKLLTSDDSYAVRAAAARGLGTVRPEGAFDRLVAALGQRSHREAVRAGALEALAELGDERAGEHLFRFTRVGVPYDVRPAAIRALARWGSERTSAGARRAVRERLERIASDGEMRVRREAVKGLGVLAEPASKALLSRVERSDFDGRVRGAAADALRAIARAEADKDTLARLRRRVETLGTGQEALSRRIEALEGKGADRAPADTAEEEGKGPDG